MGKYTGLKNKFDAKREQLFSDRGKYLQIQEKENLSIGLSQSVPTKL